MRIVLILILVSLSFSPNILAQSDFKTLDRETYNYFMKGDYKNLKESAGRLISQGADYYYLRIRLGIAAFNNRNYAESAKNFDKALEFNSFDTISYEYLYYNYINSGRKSDAALFLETLSPESKTSALKQEKSGIEYSFFAGGTASSFNQEPVKATSLYRESLLHTNSLFAGVEVSFPKRFSAELSITSFTKTGKFYSYEYQTGANFAFTQAQVYGKFSARFFPGYEVVLFGNNAIYKTLESTNATKSEVNLGAGILKNWWIIRTGGNFSVSNFSNSLQLRGEGYLTLLPHGNLNFYLTTGGMFQYDKNWGASFQADQEIGYRIVKNLWGETGLVVGNSFLYSRNQGYSMNNSFQIPSVVIYTNMILPLKKLTMTLSPYFAQYQNYSWNLTNYSRTNHSTVNSIGVSLKLNYNYK
jgi:hypothetical protein